MKQITTKSGARVNNSWRADKPELRRPNIIGGIEQDGKEYYVCSEGKHYEKGAFDRMFSTPKGQVKKKNHREDIAKIRNGNYVI